MVTYTQISPKMVHPRGIAGSAQEEVSLPPHGEEGLDFVVTWTMA